MSSIQSRLLLVLFFAALNGCSSIPAAPPDKRSPADPWEPLNRQIQGFNSKLDKVTLKPIATGYQVAIPQIIRTGIGNFSANLRTPLNIINQFLQGKGKDGLSETGRFLANSTFGLGGLIDVATDMGLDQKNEDFGETFAVWGVPDGPFVVVPVLGPRTLRDAVAIPLNFLADPLFHYDNSSVRDKVYFVRLVDVRERLFSADKLLEGSTDEYLTIREAYLQNRHYLIHDGSPPVDDDFYEEFDEFLEEDLSESETEQDSE